MRRKTRRHSKKKRQTKKRTNVKKTHKYNFLRGGLGVNDYQNIDINDTFTFQTGCTQLGGGGDDSTRHNKINEFKKYVFGTDEHSRLWEEILELCFEKGIPFYILTSGGKVGIIRMLQLLELSEFVTEVLCNNQSTGPNPLNTSDLTREAFRKMNKYQVIQSIIPNPRYEGIFIDNDERNIVDNGLCPNISFELATGDKIIHYPPEYRTRFGSFVSEMSLEYKSPIFGHAPVLYNKEKTNLIHTRLLQEIINTIRDTDNIKIIVSDFDGTMSPWCGALPFHIEDFARRFNSHFNVLQTRNLS